MLASLLFLSLAAQRKAPLTLPRNAPLPRPIVLCAPHRVTAGWIRMHRPTIVARLLEDADTPAGLRLARTILPPEMIAQRTRALAYFAPYLRSHPRGTLQSRPIGKGGRTVVVVGPGKTGDRAAKKDSDGTVLDYGKAAPQVPDETQAVELGSEFDSKPATQWRALGPRLVASQGGSVTVAEDKTGDTIDAVSFGVETGEIKNGLMETKEVPVVPGGSYPVAAGQTYYVVLNVNKKALGDYKATVVLNGGGRKVTLNVHATVVKVPQTSCWVEGGPFDLVKGGHMAGKVHVRHAGNGSTKVKLSATSDSPSLAFDLPGYGPDKSYSMKADDEIVLPFTVSVVNDLGAVDHKVHFAVMADDTSSQQTTVDLPVHVQTTWTVYDTLPGVDPSNAGFNIAGSMMCGSDGTWSVDMTETDSASPPRQVILVAVLTNSLEDGSHPGMLCVNGSAFEAPRSPCQWSFGGYDAHLLHIANTGEPPDFLLFPLWDHEGFTIAGGLDYLSTNFKMTQLNPGPPP